MHEKYPYKFDTRRLVAAFGGATACHKALRSVGCDVQLKTVQKWVERGNLPADAIAAMMVIAQKKGRTLDIASYLLEEYGGERAT